MFRLGSILARRVDLHYTSIGVSLSLRFSPGVFCVNGMDLFIKFENICV